MLGARASRPRRGQIYWVDFGEPRGSEQAGRRPAIVVSTDDLNAVSSTVIVAAMTTREWRPQRPEQHVYFTTHVGPQAVRSTIKADQILTITTDRLGDLIGGLPDEFREQLDSALFYVLGLDDVPDVSEVE
ncbi:MAG TPA: type II toxin-antitoxin system PemK/MazF family toxin [Candidatus Limnocylindrales bacterium]